MIDYEYIPDKMNTIVARGWWVYRVNPQIVGTWTGTNASAAYELAIGRDGQATLKTSGITESGVVGHNEHYQDEGADDRIVLMDDGRPVLNGCGNPRFALGEGANPQPPTELKVQEWRYCINEDNLNMMYAQAPPHGDDWMLDIALARN